jgi:hypothetical protein
MGLDLNGKIEGTLTWYYCTMGNFGDFKIPILWFYELVFSCIFMIPHESLILFMIRMGMKFLMVISQQIMRSPWTTNRFSVICWEFSRNFSEVWWDQRVTKPKTLTWDFSIKTLIFFMDV